MTKPIVVCADDYALDVAVSEGIVSLIRKGVVSATSAMVLSPSWAQDARMLQPLREQVDVGLHLDFTSEFADLTALGHTLPSLMMKSALRLLDAAQVREHVARQFDAFEQHWGAAPDHIDGHQHVHQFPVIREVLLAECKRRYAGRMPWLRWSQPLRASSSLKRQVIAAWGATSIERLARDARMPLSGPLLGVYGFDATDGVYSTHMRDWLIHADSGCLLMCHPAAGPDPVDRINPARQREYAYLDSPKFVEDLVAASCEVVRGSVVYRDFSHVDSVQA